MPFRTIRLEPRTLCEFFSLQYGLQHILQLDVPCPPFAFLFLAWLWSFVTGKRQRMRFAPGALRRYQSARIPVGRLELSKMIPMSKCSRLANW